MQIVTELRSQSGFCHKTKELWGELLSALGAQPMKHLFNCSSELKRAGGVLEIYVLNGVPKRFLNMSNLVHFDHFLSICVGDPFGPQVVGALAQKCNKSCS